MDRASDVKFARPAVASCQTAAMSDASDPTSQVLTAAGGLRATIDGDVVRIGHGANDDWFGPATLRVSGTDRPLGEGRTVGGVDDLGEWTATMWLDDRGASPRVDASLAAYSDQPILVFSLRAPTGIDAGLATGTFEDPSVAFPVFAPRRRVEGGVPDDATAFGYQYMEFALPTATDASFAGWTRWPFRPAVMMPLMCVTADTTLMVAPLDAFHEQVISVPGDQDPSSADSASGDPVGEVRCGWHGDLASVPKGFSTEMAVIAGADARECLDRWAAILTDRAGTSRLPRGIDALGSHVSYWTDNGAAYWYRTEPAADGDGAAGGGSGAGNGRRSVTETLVDTLDDLREREVPFRSVQLDSWFYPHRTIRPFDTEAWDVPPTGLDRWQARDDILPDGISALRDALGGPPLVAHCRHLSSDSPYLADHECWVDGEYAHPVDSTLYETYLDQCQAWGVETFEHDWLVECFLGVRGLREAPGRAAAWQQGLDRALADRGMTAQWCMATPADMMASTSLGQVTSIRTSGDHGYLVPPELLWAWFLYTNAMVRPLGLWPYKDVFRSDGHGGSTDPGAEAALAALSGGPVGIGDALGGADRDLVLRTARRDGLLVAPDAPIAAIGRCFAHHGVLHPEPVVGATHTQHAAGRWSYVITMNCHDASESMSTRISVDDLGDDAPSGGRVDVGTGAVGGGGPGAPDAEGVGGPTDHGVALLDWRTGEVSPLGPDGWDVELGAKGWALHVLAPRLAGGRLAVFGDGHRYATAGRQRVSDVSDHGGHVQLRLAGADEVVTLVGWSDASAVSATVRSGGPAASSVEQSVAVGDGGRWELAVELPVEPGWVLVDLRA